MRTLASLTWIIFFAFNLGVVFWASALLLKALMGWSPWLSILLTATVVERTKDGRDLLAVRFRLDRPLADPDLLFLRWDGEAFRPLDLAALPPGKSVILADTSDVWASMM